MAYVDPVSSKIILEVDLANLIEPSAKIAGEPTLMELVKLMIRGIPLFSPERFMEERWPLRDGKLCHSNARS